MGTSNYTYQEIVNFLFPIWMSLLFVSFTLGILYVLLVRFLTSTWVPGWATVTLAILMTSSVQLFCLGIIGEYIGRNYLENKDRPLYLLDEKVGFDS